MAVEELIALQRRLNGAQSVGELLALGTELGAPACGFDRGVVLALEHGRLTAATREAVADRGSDALRRTALADPIAISPESEEAELMRRAEGLTSWDATASVVAGPLGLRQYVIAALAPEARALGLVVFDRDAEPVQDHDREAVEMFTHLLGLSIERLVLRLRLRELSSEFRHLTASANALLQEATEAGIALTSDFGHGPVFARVGGQVRREGALLGLLNEREATVAGLLAEGLSNREIGERMHLSSETIKSHVARILRKLGVSNRVEAAARFTAESLAASAEDANDR